MGQFGGGRMGGIAPAAGSTVPQIFRNIPGGNIARLLITLSFGLKSSGSAFAGVVSTGASAASEGTDDMDLLLNAILSRLAMYFEAGSLAGNLTPAQWRTILGLFNVYDFGGTLVNAFAVPSSGSSATTFTVIMSFPINLEHYWPDGAIFSNGSLRLASGQVEYTFGSSLTPSVVLANGTAVVSALAVDIQAETGPGSPSDVGMLWRVHRQANLPTIYQFSDGFRIALLDTETVSANSATDITIGPFERFKPANYGANYTSDKLPMGGFDITKRCTPLIFMGRNRQFATLGAALGGAGLKIDAATGTKSSLTVYDVMGIPATPEATAAVAAVVGAGGAVSLVRPSPPSLPAGSRVSPDIAHFLPTRVLPGKIADGGTGVASKRANPSDVAQGTAQQQLKAGVSHAKGRLFRKGGVK